MNDQATSIKSIVRLKVSKDFGSHLGKNIKQNSSIHIKIKLESSNNSVINKPFESPNPTHIRHKENDKEKINNFRKPYDKKYSISPTLQMKKDQIGNNGELGEFKLELRSIFNFCQFFKLNLEFFLILK